MSVISECNQEALKHLSLAANAYLDQALACREVDGSALDRELAHDLARERAQLVRLLRDLIHQQGQSHETNNLVSLGLLEHRQAFVKWANHAHGLNLKA